MIRSTKNLPFKNIIFSIFDTAIYDITIYIDDSLKSQTNLRLEITGNKIILVNKYLGALFFILLCISTLKSSAESSSIYLSYFLILMPITIWPIGLNHVNKAYIKKGYEQINKLLLEIK